MADSKAKSFARQIQELMETRPDFSHKFKQRIVFESSKVANPFKFIGGLLSKGVLADGPNDSDSSFGLKEWMVQLATTLACSKGAGGIGGLMEALQESGNSALISSIRTWIQEDSGMETAVDLSEPKKIESVVKTSASDVLPKTAKNKIKLSSIAIKFIDNVMSHKDRDLMKEIEGHLVAMAPIMVNSKEFCSSLVHQNVLDESDVKLKTGPELQAAQWTTRAIKAACAKKAIGSLVVAFQRSGNGHILEETIKWLETSQVRTKNCSTAVENLANQRIRQQSKLIQSTFFEQPAPSNGLEKVATFSYEPETSRRGTRSLEFDRERMIAHFTDDTVKVWDWQENVEKTIKFYVQVKNITAFQYDEEILVVGTRWGAIHLFDARTSVEKWSIRLDIGNAVYSLKFSESTLAVLTRGSRGGKVWWLEINRSDMRLLYRKINPIGVHNLNKGNPGIVINPVCSYTYSGDYCVGVTDTMSGECSKDLSETYCCLRAQGRVNAMNIVVLNSTKTVVAGGCTNGEIAIWNVSKSIESCSPVKTLRGHTEAIVSLCGVSGHLLSLDKSGKLLLWSGYDLENESIRAPVPRVLAEYFFNVTMLAGYERWFATGSSEDGTVNIWTLPDLWLRTG